ncbi:hypothetical protein POTOM_005243 [Populus tomentosa]|uniref:Late embryogenesis abundant protein LEA-2 subgroup domain-containing protein n=1 Tax=Populus tomentosa TaxID=118781 RepID=A0A8X8ARR8_POPTO|nr:hypothetical protein POTOM_005243 [Populus tomentosa]
MDKSVSKSSQPSGGNGFPTSSSNGRKLNKKLVYLCSIVMAVLFFLGIAAIVFLFLLHKNPKATNKNIAIFRVDSILVSRFKLSSSKITASWDIRLSVQNPSTASVLYQTFYTWIQYKQERLSNVTNIAPFQVRGNTWTAENGKLVAKSVRADERRVWRAVEAHCSDLKIGFSSKDNMGKLIGEPIECNILTKTW